MRSKLWIKENFLFPYFSLAAWALGFNELHDLRKFFKRIVRLYINQQKCKNFRFLHLYFKDCYTITQFRLANESYTDLKFRVALAKDGFPAIIPGSLRSQMSDRRIAVMVLTCLAIYRVIPWWPEADLQTVIQPFSGLSRTIPIMQLKTAVRRLRRIAGLGKKYIILLSKPRLLMTRSSGPSGQNSLNWAVQDAMAFWWKPWHMLALFKMLFHTRGIAVFVAFMVTLTVSFPLWLCWSLPAFRLGKIGVIRNVAGKARVIGITNYWIQVALRPIHNEIFNILSRIKTDGTFDQLAPVKRLANDQEYSSYDLSAATDRLPLDVQEQILGLFFGRAVARTWAQLVSFPLFYKDWGSDVVYAVGQPMGAYSSWASLALSHHVLVMLAAGRDGYDNYALLGDDVVVSADIGDAYKAIMTCLGVSISPAKSIIKNKFIEFAKRLIDTSTGDDYSVLGPGLILNCILNKAFKLLLLKEVSERGLCDENSLRVKIRELENDKGCRALSRYGQWLLFGPIGLIAKQPVVLPSGKMFGGCLEILRDHNALPLVYEIFAQYYRERWDHVRQIAWRECGGILSYLLRYASPAPYSSLFYMSLLFSPSFWVPLRDLSEKALMIWEEPNERALPLESLLAKLDDLEPIQLEIVTRLDARAALRKFKRFLWWEEFILPIYAGTSSDMLRYVRLRKAIKSHFGSFR